MFKFRITATVLLGLALVLSGCAQTGRDTPKTAGPATPLSPAERAERALSLAANSIAPHRQLHQLDAAEFLVLAGDNQQALKVLSSLDQNALSGQRLVEFRLLFAKVAMAQERFFLARDLLTDPEFTTNAAQLPTSLRVKWQKLRGELFSLLGEDEQSIRAYAELSSLVTSTGEQTAISEAIWRLLTHISQKHLAALQATESDPLLQGWYTLASRVRENQGDMDKQLREITDWQAEWPDHPAALYPPPSLTALQEVASNLPEQIAVLLPLQGSLAEAGKAIRGGILSAWYDVRGARGKTPLIRFYDTSSSDDIGPLYQQAISEGAELIIGPVQREKVGQLLALPDLPVPTVALNYLDTPSTEVRQNFFQFGLSSTAEARQVADRAWLEGRRFALTITPDSSSGIRALGAFRERWHERGGTLVEVPAYAASQSDFIALLKPELQIEQSIERNNRLQRLLGKQLAHTPRRRQDLDMVFLIASPSQARQIKPTLDFLFASDLQVYGTSQLFSGIQDPGRNRDLDGVRFSAMPWTLPGYSADAMQPAEDLEPIYRHMYALGIDTYHLHQWLGQMLLFPNIRLPGNTGMLYLTPPDTIEREQPWGVFKNGRVVPAIPLQKKILEAEHQTAPRLRYRDGSETHVIFIEKCVRRENISEKGFSMTKGKPPARSNQSGAIAEQWARTFLERQGLVTLHRNYRTPQGEIDLIMQEGQTVVFVEVRLRNHAAFGGAIYSIDHRKQRRIIAAARHFLQATQAWDKVACRFDAVCLCKDITNDPSYQVEWLPNAFDH